MRHRHRSAAARASGTKPAPGRRRARPEQCRRRAPRRRLRGRWIQAKELSMPTARSRGSTVPAALFAGGLRALNVGVSEFALSPRAHGATVLELDWRPPAGGDRDLGLLVARLEDDPDDPIGSQVAAANARAIERILAARPLLVGMGRAADLLPGLGPRHLLHAGPPIAWGRMCGPMRGAIV